MATHKVSLTTKQLARIMDFERAKVTIAAQAQAFVDAILLGHDLPDGEVQLAADGTLTVIVPDKAPEAPLALDLADD